MTNISLPPKLSVPHLDQVIDRERLFAQLDQRLSSGAVVWLEGMAGAGKTVLAASYVARRQLPALWYRLDAGDADPAAFFHYLAQAWRQLLAGKKARPLPVLGTEYLGTSQVVTCRTAQGTTLRARLSTDLPTQRGDHVGLAFETGQLSLFDAASGRALRTVRHEQAAGAAHG